MRFLLDTNVVSETMRGSPNRRMLRKLAQHDGQFGISALTWHELAFGVRCLPRGARRTALEARLRDISTDLPAPLPFTGAAGDWLASERARLEAKGISISMEDGVIAAWKVADWRKHSSEAARKELDLASLRHRSL